jgi:hypothetical protein
VQEKEKVDEKDGRIWRVIQQRRQSSSSFSKNFSYRLFVNYVSDIFVPFMILVIA